MSPAPAVTVRRAVKSGETAAAQEAQPALERAPRVSSIAEALSRWLNQQL